MWQWRIRCWFSCFPFQSTHPRRVWQAYSVFDFSTDTFQSTHPRRVWLSIPLHPQTWILVSIHTPTQGVTGWENPFECPNRRFNPHTHAGCDFVSPCNWMSVFEFQSTHPRRVWLRIPDISLSWCVSIHTPTQGVTIPVCPVGLRTGFNPHTHAGCDYLEQ